MNLHPLLAAICLLLLPLAALADSVEETLWIESRGTLIPASWVVPTGEPATGWPLVVMAHGHASDRHEGGAFRQLANRLAAVGVASIRVDFPGCGDSREPFTNNNLGNMMADVVAARDFALATGEIDAGRVALLGWSMGGRIALTLAAQADQFAAIGVWAPGAVPGGSLPEMFGGPDLLARARQEAEQRGFFATETSFGKPIRVGPGFFADLEVNDPLAAVAGYPGPLLVVFGDRDEVVPPAVARSVVQAAVNAAEVRQVKISGATHALGVFTQRPELTEAVLDATVDFFIDHLGEPR